MTRCFHEWASQMRQFPSPQCKLTGLILSSGWFRCIFFSHVAVNVTDTRMVTLVIFFLMLKKVLYKMIVERAAKLCFGNHYKPAPQFCISRCRCVWTTKVCNQAWNRTIQSGHRKKQPSSILVFTFSKRAARPRGPACQKPNQGVCFRTGAFQNQDISALNEWTLQQPWTLKYVIGCLVRNVQSLLE